MRIGIREVSTNYLDEIAQLCNEYNVIGHIENGIDGIWFVVDEIKRKVKE